MTFALQSLRAVALAAMGFLMLMGLVAPAAAQTPAKPNILVIFGDDIGIANISAYSDGVMGYATPHIDRRRRPRMTPPSTRASARSACKPSRTPAR